MRAFCLFLVCLALTARPAMSAEDDAAISKADESSSNKKDATDAVELLETAETNNNNNTAVAEEGETKTNSKRTIDHNLGYGYRFNSVLRPVPHMHHYMPSMPGLPYMRRPMFKQQRYPHHHFPSGFSSGPASSPSASGPAAGAAPFRFSQPLPSPPHRDEEQPQHQIREQLREQLHDQLREQLREQPATRPVTEAPSGPHTENVYRTLPFSYEDEPQKTVTMTAGMEASSSKAESEQQATPESPVQYADEPATGPTSSAAHSYQQVLQHLQQASEPTYILASTATAPHSLMYSAASHASQLTTPLTAVFGHGMGGGQGGHPVMYAPHVASGAATQMIPVIIVRLMDSQPAAATLGAAQVPSHHLSAVPYPLVNMQLLREHLSKMYSSQHSVTPQFMAAEPEPVVYSSPLFSSAQLQKLQLQHQLHSQLQKQLQVQQLQQQQRQSVAALLQEQHRQRLASLSGQQHSQQHSQQRGSLSGLRTEVTVHRSPALSPQDYKESVEQQEEA